MCSHRLSESMSHSSRHRAPVRRRVDALTGHHVDEACAVRMPLGELAVRGAVGVRALHLKNERRAAAVDRDASLLIDASTLEVLAPVVAEHRDREVLAARLWAGLPVVEVAPD
jgi:hypothetical protein